MNKHIVRMVGVGALLPGIALAHAGGETSGLLHGLLHPIGGIDHLLAMVAVGLLAARSKGDGLLGLPLAFLAAMAMGALLVISGLTVADPLVAVEPLILASVVVLGLLVAAGAPLSLTVGVPLVALFGLAHGQAHALEMAGASMLVYGAGFMAATSALHGLGIWLGRLLPGTIWSRLTGFGMAATGLAIAIV
jgi:urease accessory protein